MDLLILAAGLGSRFGGLKQIEPVDKDGNFIIDYSIYDAIKAGFDRVVFIIAKENEEIFKETIGNRIAKHVKVAYVFQDFDTDNFPQTRTKPLGTAYAIMKAKDVISNKFLMINADDFYGYEAFKEGYEFLANLPEDSKNVYGNIAYKVINTMSEFGSVKRGVLMCSDSKVDSLIESSIAFENGKIMASPLNGSAPFELNNESLVSMNMFAFSKDVMDLIVSGYPIFLKTCNKEKDEYLIPDLIKDRILDGTCKVTAQVTNSIWYGITYRTDLEGVVKAIENYVKEGRYPASLWK